MGDYTHEINLHAHHASQDLSGLASQLGLKPWVIWKVGDARVTPKGTPLGGKRTDSYFTASLPVLERLPETLAAAVAALSPHKALLDAFVADGGGLSFFVGWYWKSDPEATSSQFGAWLDFRLLSEIAALHISLDLDCYGADKADWQIDH